MSGKRKRKEWDPKDVDNAFADILDEVLSLVCNKNIGQSDCIQCIPWKCGLIHLIFIVIQICNHIYHKNIIEKQK